MNNAWCSFPNQSSSDYSNSDTLVSPNHNVGEWTGINDQCFWRISWSPPAKDWGTENDIACHGDLGIRSPTTPWWWKQPQMPQWSTQCQGYSTHVYQQALNGGVSVWGAVVCMGVGEGPILFQSNEKWLLFSERHPFRINVLLIRTKGRAIMAITIFITAESCPVLMLTQCFFN